LLRWLTFKREPPCQYSHYRPDLGRYLTPDPIGISGGLNLYSYAGQNPINRYDFYGLEDNTTPWGVGWEWLTGSDTRHHYFTDGDPFTEMLRKVRWSGGPERCII